MKGWPQGCVLCTLQIKDSPDHAVLRAARYWLPAWLTLRSEQSVTFTVGCNDSDRPAGSLPLTPPTSHCHVVSPDTLRALHGVHALDPTSDAPAFSFYTLVFRKLSRNVNCLSVLSPVPLFKWTRQRHLSAGCWRASSSSPLLLVLLSLLSDDVQSLFYRCFDQLLVRELRGSRTFKTGSSAISASLCSFKVSIEMRSEWISIHSFIGLQYICQCEVKNTTEITDVRITSFKNLTACTRVL